MGFPSADRGAGAKGSACRPAFAEYPRCDGLAIERAPMRRCQHSDQDPDAWITHGSRWKYLNPNGAPGALGEEFGGERCAAHFGHHGDDLHRRRVSLAIQRVDLSGPPSAEESSTLNASNVPAGTVTLSDPATCKLHQLHFLLLHIEIAKGSGCIRLLAEDIR